MQVFEALIWRDQACGSLNKGATIGAYLANVLQPIFVLLVLLFVTKSNIYLQMTAFILVMGYMAYILYYYNKHVKLECTKSKDCHLYYDWWSTFGAAFYVITLISVILLLARPLSYALMISGYILLILFIAILGFNSTIASTWCWMAAFAPIFTIFFYKMSQKIGW